MRKLLTALLLVAALPAAAQWNVFTRPQSTGGGGGATPPSAPTNSVQFNSAGSFGGSANFLWDGTGITLGASGTLGRAIFGNATSGTLTLQPVTGALGTPTLSLPAATDTLTGKATTDTLTNKTYDTAGTGNVFKINGNSFVNTNCDSTHFVRGDGTCQTVSAGSVALSAITPATGANAMTTSGDFQQTWPWTKTTDSSFGLRITEGTASTGGTSTSGVPNQAILKVDTLAASTASPLTVYSRASHVFSVSPSAAQILATNGADANPTYAFASSVNTGLWWNGTMLRGVVGGSLIFGANASQFLVPSSASFSAPSIADSFSSSNGFTINGGNNSINVAIAGGQFATLSATSNIAALQLWKGVSDTNSQSLRFNKARGTVASPSVITTGDALGTVSGYGYVGSTNTYLEGTRISSFSAGTITDATTGIGGQLRWSTAKQGVDTGPVERMRLDDFGHLVTVHGTANTPALGTCTNGTLTGGTDNAFLVTFSGANSSCAVNFGTAFATNAPVCTASAKTVAGTQITDLATTTGAVTITPSAAYANTDTVMVICVGRL